MSHNVALKNDLSETEEVFDVEQVKKNIEKSLQNIKDYVKDEILKEIRLKKIDTSKIASMDGSTESQINQALNKKNGSASIERLSKIAECAGLYICVFPVGLNEENVPIEIEYHHDASAPEKSHKHEKQRSLLKFLASRAIKEMGPAKDFFERNNITRQYAHTALRMDKNKATTDKLIELCQLAGVTIGVEVISQREAKDFESRLDNLYRVIEVI